MNVPGLTIEALFHEKILLYRDLIEILKREKESIVNIDVDALWKISDKKQRIASNLEGIRRKILDRLTEASLPHDMDTVTFQTGKILSLLPIDMRNRIRQAHVTLVSLENDARKRLEENSAFVGEYLAVLDELIGIVTDTGSPKPVYGKSRCPQRTAANLLVHRKA
jgi:hypothetical protein